jgi:hypothetical protein
MSINAESIFSYRTMLSERGPGEMLLAHCQRSAPAFAQRSFPFELGKSIRQQHLSAEDPFWQRITAIRKTHTPKAQNLRPIYNYQKRQNLREYRVTDCKDLPDFLRKDQEQE